MTYFWSSLATDGIKTSGRINSLNALRRVFLGDPFIPAVNTS
jgi:hypothetical protein